MSIILIKQIPDDYAEANGLAKYNKSRMPGTSDRFSASENIDGRYLTNIDEESILVSNEKKEEIKALRENLERKTKKDLSGTSDFWKTFEVTIFSNKPKAFDTENPYDVIGYNLLISNGYVAPNRDAASTANYRNAQYYAYTEAGEVDEEVGVSKRRDKAIAALVEMSENKEKMLLYGQYLEGLKYSNKLREADLYKLLRAYIDNKDIKNADNFLAALKESVEKIQVKLIIDRSLKQHLITKSGSGKNFVYQYGNITLGTSLEDLYKNLLLPDFATELVSLKKTLEDK